MERRLIDAEKLLDDLNQALPDAEFMKVMQIVNGQETVEQKTANG